MSQKISTKQAVLFALINYFGVLIGVISTVLIYPQDKEMLGVIRFVDAGAQILFPILVLGGPQALINFYPNLEPRLQQKLFGFSLISIFKMSLCALLVLIIATYTASSIPVTYLWMALPLGVCMAYIELFRRQATHLQKLAIPTLFEKIIPKITLPLAFLLVLYWGMAESQALWLYVGSYAVVVLIVAFYIHKQEAVVVHANYAELFSKLSKSKYYSYSLYAFAGSFGSFFAFRFDSIMIPSFISFEANGTYNIAVTLASTLAIPATGVFALYAPIVSDLIKKGQWQALNIKYKEVSSLLFFIGALLYSCIVVGIDPLFQLLPTYESLAPSIPIIVLLGFNVVVNMSTGFNTEIISFSKHYRFNLVSILALMFVNVGLNWLLLTQTQWGILGVACASLFSLTLFNLAKTLFIVKKMQLFPFNRDFLKMALFVSVVLLALYEMPNAGSPLFTLVYKVFLVLAVNVTGVYAMKWNPSLNYWLDKTLLKRLK